jgi:hypothetical protein
MVGAVPSDTNELQHHFSDRLGQSLGCPCRHLGMQITILKSRVSAYEHRDMEVSKTTLFIDSWGYAFHVPFTGFRIIKLR